MGQQTPLRAWHQQPGQDPVQVGRAFFGESGIDMQLHYAPLTQGRVLILLREGDAPVKPAEVKGQAWVVLHKRPYKVGQEEKVAWTRVGRASMHDAGVDLVLDYLPPFVDGVVRLLLRPDDRDQRAAAPQQASRGAQYGGAAAGHEQPRRAPQHRDELAVQQRLPTGR